MSIRDVLNSELGQEVKRLREENEEVHAAVARKQKELMVQICWLGLWSVCWTKRNIRQRTMDGWLRMEHSMK